MSSAAVPSAAQPFADRWEKRTLPWLTGLAVLSLMVYVSTAAMEKPPRLWTVIDYSIWAMFAVDFVLRLALAEQRWTFIRRNPLDLLALLMPSVRALRLLTIIGRLSAVTRRGKAERLLASTGVVVALAIVALAAAVLNEERDAPGATITTLPEALWWAMTTTTTVGYGDLTPVTDSGRLYGSVLMVIGIGTMGTVTAALASRLVPSLGSSPVSPPGAPGETPLDTLERLAALRESGAITTEEFAAKKSDLLVRV